MKRPTLCFRIRGPLLSQIVNRPAIFPWSCSRERFSSGEVEYLVEPGAGTDEDACLLRVTVPKTDPSLKA
ncbi:MAG: hypothetical protein ACP5SH_16760 [Syntrophobacteraceae bacterium]